MASPFPGYVTLLEASQIVGVHHTTLRRDIKEGRIAATVAFGAYPLRRADCYALSVRLGGR